LHFECESMISELEQMELLMFIEMSKEELRSLLQFYFSRGRPRYLKIIEQNMIKNFKNLINSLNDEELVNISSEMFLFCYTLATEYKNIQNLIYNDIAIPYFYCVKQRFKKIKVEFPERNKKTKHESFLLIVRHATVKGMYSPGQTTFFISKKLLERHKKLSLLVFGEIDEKFFELEKIYSKLEIYKMPPDAKFSERINILETLCMKGGFDQILTDQEFSEISFVTIKNKLKNVTLVSAGFYRVPWYTKILKPSVLGAPNNSRELQVPMPIEMELLDPIIDPSLIIEFKNTYQIKDEDLVFGCFARLEKFTEQYIDIATKILNKIPQSKLLIAGTNSKTFLEKSLATYIKEGRATILGYSDSHILGHVLSFGLETTPTLSGSTVLELYAKKIPVLTCSYNVTDIDYINRARVPEFVFSELKDIEKFFDKICSKRWIKSAGEIAYNFVKAMADESAADYVKMLM
jgi:hypothetical protein